MRGFGFIYDFKLGYSRRWYLDADERRRWADNDAIVLLEEINEPDPPSHHELFRKGNTNPGDAQV